MAHTGQDYLPQGGPHRSGLPPPEWPTQVRTTSPRVAHIGQDYLPQGSSHRSGLPPPGWPTQVRTTSPRVAHTGQDYLPQGGPHRSEQSYHKWWHFGCYAFFQSVHLLLQCSNLTLSIALLPLQFPHSLLNLVQALPEGIVGGSPLRLQITSCLRKRKVYSC